MRVYAGKSFNSRYERTAPIHLAVENESEHSVRSVCHGKVVSPAKGASPITITCPACQAKAFEMRSLLN